jgi:hypothetical protein
MDTQQLNLFATGISCVHCHQDPGRDPKNSHLWFGFLDLDTSERVCFQCRDFHYRIKSMTDKKGLYSEFPVMADNEFNVHK